MVSLLLWCHITTLYCYQETQFGVNLQHHFDVIKLDKAVKGSAISFHIISFFSFFNAFATE